MVAGWPTPYGLLFDPDVKIDSMKSMRAGLRADLKEFIEFDQSSIGLLSRIKEQTKDDQELQALCSSIISTEILLIRLEHEEINALCE